MGARVYDPYTGTFTQPDPIQGADANSYGYADGDPVNDTDLDGDAAQKGKLGTPAAAAKIKNKIKTGAAVCLLWCGLGWARDTATATPPIPHVEPGEVRPKDPGDGSSSPFSWLAQTSPAIGALDVGVHVFTSLVHAMSNASPEPGPYRIPDVDLVITP